MTKYAFGVFTIGFMDERLMPRLTTLRPRLAVLDSATAKPPAKQADPHYLSLAHRQWRGAVMARAGGRCQWPGCGRHEARMFADHIVELHDGGAALDLANGQCLCGRHHSLKTAQARARRMGLGR